MSQNDQDAILRARKAYDEDEDSQGVERPAPKKGFFAGASRSFKIFMGGCLGFLVLLILISIAMQMLSGAQPETRVQPLRLTQQHSQPQLRTPAAGDSLIEKAETPGKINTPQAEGLQTPDPILRFNGADEPRKPDEDATISLPPALASEQEAPAAPLAQSPAKHPGLASQSAKASAPAGEYAGMTLAELRELNTLSKEIAATLRGEGMATISKEELAGLMQGNQDLRDELAAAREEIKKAKELTQKAEQEAKSLRTQVATLESQIRKFEADLDAYIAKTKRPGEYSIAEKPAAKPVEQTPVAANAPFRTKPAEQQETKFPFTFVGLTDSFVVVRKTSPETKEIGSHSSANSTFTTLKIGQSLDGITITAIDVTRNTIKTNVGNYTLKPSGKQ